MPPHRILFLTNPEHGQSTIHLATAFEIQSRGLPDVELHFASFASLRGRFERMAKITTQDGHRSPTFHAIDGLPPFVAMDRITEYMPLQHPPTLAACPKFSRLTVPWTPEEYIAIVNDIVAVIERVDPHLIIIDNVLGQAMDACALLKRQYHIFSPLLPSLVCNANQPLLHRLFRYPQMATALPYPLPWYGAFVNIAHIVSLMYYVLTSPYIKALNDARAAQLDITEFTMAGHTFTHVLSVCPALVKLRLCLCRDPVWMERPPRALSCLEEATFVVGDPDIFAPMFSRLTTPRLKYLQLRGVSKADHGSRPGYARRMLQLDAWPLTEFTGWLHRSQCTLDTFSLLTIAMPRDHVVAILERLPSLESFTIWEDYEPDAAWAEVADEPIVYSSIDDGLLRRMTAVDGAAPSLLPRLKRLSIKGELQFNHSALVDMVRSRSKPHLEYLRIYAGGQSRPDDMDEDIKAQLRVAMGEDGIMEFDSSASISKSVDFMSV